MQTFKSALASISSAMNPRETRKSKNSTSLAVAASCAGPGNALKSKEDRTVTIDNLALYLSKNKYDVGAMGDSAPPPLLQFPQTEQGEDQTFCLYAVFDGHVGAMASTFCQKRLPFELCGTEEFARGEYEQALKVAVQRLHRALLDAKKYEPEAPRNDFSSGCTASIVLVTPKQTVCAMLGDSPILAWERSKAAPDIVFTEMDLDNEPLHDVIIESNIFLVVAVEAQFEASHFFVTGDKSRRRLLNVARERIEAAESKKVASAKEESAQARKTRATREAESAAKPDIAEAKELPDTALVANTDKQEVDADAGGEGSSDGLQHATSALAPEDAASASISDDAAVVADEGAGPVSDILKNDFDDVRIGLSALNVWGSIGDSSYDPEVFNTFVDEIVEYRRLRALRWEECVAKQAIGNAPPTPNAVEAAPAGNADTAMQDENAAKRAAASPTDTPRMKRKTNVVDEGAELGSASQHSSASSSEHMFDFEHDPKLLPVVSPMNDPVGGIPYTDFRAFTLNRPAWKMLRHHISLLPKEATMSRVLLTALRHLSAVDVLRRPGLVREPVTKTFENSDLKMFVIASDGVVRWYSKHKNDYDQVSLRSIWHR